MHAAKVTLSRLYLHCSARTSQISISYWLLLQGSSADFEQLTSFCRQQRASGIRQSVWISGGIVYLGHGKIAGIDMTRAFQTAPCTF
jgi:hypothetical protein